MWLVILLVVLLVLCTLLLVFAVILQNSKGGGLVSTMRGASEASAIFGARRAADIIERATWWLAGVFVVLTFAINIVYSTSPELGKGKAGNNLESELENVTAPRTQPPAQPAPSDQPAPAN